MKQEYEEAKTRLQKNPTDKLGLLLYNERKRYFGRYDALLDGLQYGPDYLRNPEVAEIIRQELHHFDGELYTLQAYCIMPNHVHILIDTRLQIPEEWEPEDGECLDYAPLEVIMKRIKGRSAIAANRVLGRSGRFWQRESYDHYVRNEREWENILHYILNNPVKVGWVERWEDWPYTYCRP
ncbi:MAG: transposase [Saprospiraceae bacterium]|nr:transposase [Saprospiraceae bacterium]MDW8229972.1 transposase [Saprospiraceae bacterium]